MEGQLGSTDNRIIEMNNRVTELNGKQGQLVTTLEKVRVGQMSMTDAMAQATPRAQELIKWIQILGIQSPFTSDGIQKAFQTALAYGFTTEQAQRLTAAEVDFTAATGKSSQAADLIALALGQIQSRGKVAAQELRQLSEQGIGTNRILEDMGFTLDDVTNGLVDTDIFIEAVIQDMEIFKGAAKDQATTFSGLVTSLSEVKAIGLREFFTGTFESIRPYLANFVDFLTKAAFETGSIRALGDVLGQKVGGALAIINRWVTLISQLGGGAGLTIFSDLFGPQGITLWAQIGTLVGNVADTFSEWSGVLGGILPSFSEFSGGIIPALISGLTFLNQHFEEFKGAMLGIGAVMGGAVFAAVVAGLIGLLTPINLIIAGAALLGAAWAGNWGDIQGKTMAAWAIIQPILAQVAGWLQVNIPVAIQTASGFWTNTLQPAMVQVGGWITGTLIPTLTEVWGWLNTNIPIAVQFLSDTWTNYLLPALTGVWGFISSTLIPLFSDFVSGYIEVTSTRLQVLADTWTLYLLPALTAVWGYLNQNIFPLVQAINGFIGAVFNKTIEAAAGLWQNILWPALQKVWSLISNSLQPIFQDLAGTISEDVSPILNYLGETILPLLSDGLEIVTEWIKKATDFFNGLKDAVNSFELPEVLQRHSPSPFEQSLIGISNAALVAKSAIAALTQGVSTGSAAFREAVGNMFGLESILAGTGLVGEGRRHDIDAIFRNVLGGIIPQIEAGTFGMNELLAAINQGAELGGISLSQALDAIERGGYTLQQLLDNLNTSFSETQKALRLARAAQSVGIAGQFAQFGITAADRLQSRIETLQAIVDSGTEGAFGGQIISATQAQEELNQALADQVTVQQQIVDLQRQQADLQFLQQQIALIQMIKDAGLNVEDILGGITLGLDASLPDIVAAMNAVVQAMLDQIDDDLAIQSPSKVMFDKFRQVGLGAAKGIMSTKGILERAFAPVVQPLLSAGPGVQGSPVNNNTYYDFNMTVNTGASPQGVIRQYSVMAGMLA
jgi:tape measure domain-containing protein